MQFFSHVRPWWHHSIPARVLAVGLAASVSAAADLPERYAAGPKPQAAGNPWFAGPPKIPPVVELGAGRQLFVDDYLIESTNLTRTFHRPTMYAGNPVLKPDRPWEDGHAMPFSDGIWYDQKDHLFKMWYNAS